MYLNYLDEDQQRVFVEAATLTIRSDNALHVSEQDLLDAIRDETGRDLPAPDVSIELESVVADALRSYREPAQRNAFMLELAAVCVIDGESHPAELEVLSAFANALGVSQSKLDEFVSFAHDAYRLATAGDELLASEAGD